MGFNLIKGKETIIVNVEKEDLIELQKQYDSNVWEILKEQIDYSNSKKDNYRIIDKKSSKRLFAKKFTSIRKLTISPVEYINKEGISTLTYGVVLWKNRIYFTIAGKDYWFYIKEYQPLRYPDGHLETLYVCVEGFNQTCSYGTLRTILDNNDIKRLKDHNELTMFALNEEKMSYEITGFFKSAPNMIIFAILGVIAGGIGGFVLGIIAGFILKK